MARQNKCIIIIIKRVTLNYVNHGEMAVVSKRGVIVAKINIRLKISTFKQLFCRVSSKGASVIIATIYGPGSVRQSAAFFKEFNANIQLLATFIMSMTLTGDVNVHLNRETDLDRMKFLDIIEAFDMRVSVPTYSSTGRST